MIGDYGLELTSKTGEHRLHIVADAVAAKFDDSLLLCPQLGELQRRILGMEYLFQLVVVHDIAGQRLLIGTNALDVDTYGLVADHTDGGLTTMAEVEVDVRVPNDAGLAVFTIFEDGSLIDAILLTQGLTQQQVGSSTRLASQLVLETQTLFPALFREQGQCRLPVEVCYVVIQIYHYELSIMN